MKGDIQPRFEITPSDSIVLGAVQSNTAAKKTLKISNKYTSPVTFTQAKADARFLKVQLREVDKGQRYELDVETIPPLPEASSLGNVVLSTDLKEQPQVVLPVHGRVQPAVMLSPKVLMLPSPVRSDITRDVKLMLADGLAVQVTRTEVPDARIRAVVETGPDKRTQRIRVTVPKDTDLPPKGQMLTIHTDHPEFPTLTCELRSFRFGRAGSVSSRPAAP